MAKNPCAKTMTPESAYEVYENASGTWRWFVLKKYQSPEHEALNPYSRWHCAVQSPTTTGRYEYGDVYATTVKEGNHRIVNPLQPLTDTGVAKLWKLLTGVPMSEQETLDTAFYIWQKHTSRFEIWQWFDEQYSGGLEALRNHVPSCGQVAKKTLIVQAVTDEVQEHFNVTDLTPRARKHKQYQIELPTECVHTISKERSIIGPIEFYDCQDGRVIVTDHAWNQVNASLKKQEVS